MVESGKKDKRILIGVCYRMTIRKREGKKKSKEKKKRGDKLHRRASAPPGGREKEP